MIADLKGTLVYVNPAWSALYGYSREEALGQTPRLLHSGHQSKAFYDLMWSQIRDPEVLSWKGELINRTREGRLVPVLLSITPYLSAVGEVRGYMGIAVDISHRKQLEAQVVHQDRLASIGLLASGLAHEIGTPLGVVRGRAELLMMKLSNETQIKELGIIVSQIDRISKLIRSLLRVSRSPSDIRMEDVSLKQVVDEVVALVGQNLHVDSVEIRVSIAEELRARADFGRLEQVLLNLVMNSTHAIRKAIESGRKGPHFLEFMAEKRIKNVALVVRDTGCGIAPENMSKLFKPFFTTKEVGEGTGLGLAIVGKLVQEMQAEVSVQSQVGVGTAFTFVFQ